MAHKDEFGPEYAAYHDRVINAIVEQLGPTGEQQREWWDSCDYLEAFAENKDPHEEASDQIQAMIDSQ